MNFKTHFYDYNHYSYYYCYCDDDCNKKINNKQCEPTLQSGNWKEK
jgi:hypothetical protein